jgi:hypothetical protein
MRFSGSAKIKFPDEVIEMRHRISGSIKPFEGERDRFIVAMTDEP